MTWYQVIDDDVYEVLGKGPTDVILNTLPDMIIMKVWDDDEGAQP